MAAVADRVIVELEAKLDKYDARLRAAEKRFGTTTSSIERNSLQMTNLVSAGVRSLGVAFAGLSVLGLARQFIVMTDEAKKMDAQLRLATAGMGSFAQAQEDVRRIAEETRSDLSATAGLYSAFARGAKELGLSQAQVAEITETVGKAFKVSGTGAVESAQAIRQLTQAFQSGVLRGDEFNSIMENAPRLAKLLSDSLGVPTGALRAMAEEGELTADKLSRAFSDTKFTEALEAEFKQIPVTFDDAMTLVYNSALVTFSEFDRGGGFSEMLVQFVTDGADGFGDLGKSAQELGLDIRSTFAGLRDAFQPLLDGARAVFEQIGIESMSLRDQVAELLGILDDTRNWLNPPGGIDAVIDEKLWGIPQTPSNMRGTFLAGAETSRRNRQAQLDGQAEMQRRRDAENMAAAAARGGGGGARPTGGRSTRRARAERSPLDPEAFARAEAQLNDDILREKQDAATTIAARADLELQRLQAEQAREAVETQANEKYTAEQKAKLVALQGSVYALKRLAVVAERDADTAEQAEKDAEKARDAREGNARLEADALESRYRLAETSKERAEIDGRLLALAEEQERADLEAAIAAGRIADAETARADLAEVQGNRREASARENESPMQRYRRGLDKSRDELGEQAEQLMVDEIEHVRSKMRDGIAKALGTDDPLITGLIDMLLEQFLIKPITDALSQAMEGQGAGGGIAGFLTTAANYVGTLFGGAPGRASGGHVQRGKFYRVTDGEGFVPPQSGKIIPLGRMRSAGSGGGLTIHQTVNVDASGSVNPDGYSDHIRAAVRQETAAIVAAGMRQVTNAVPSRMAQYERDGR